MNNLFSTNAYYLLGLPVTSDQVEIKKKARLIEAKLGIDEKELESDFFLVKPERNENSLREATQRLSNPIKKIRELYFWFSEENQDKLAKLLASEDHPIEDTIEYLSKQSEIKGQWNTKRDFALFLTQLLFYKKAEKKYLAKSLEIWKELISSEPAWKYFNLYYKNIDDLNTDESAFVQLREWADQVVSDFYSNLSEKWDDHEYTRQYTKTFGKIGSLAQKNVLGPQTKEINSAIEKLTSIDWNEKAPSSTNLKAIKEGVGSIQEALNTLIDADLYEESAVVGLRDKAADSIRDVAIALNNKYDDYERSGTLLAISEEISGTKSTKMRNKSERETITENKAAQKYLVRILELHNKGKFLEAVNYLEEELKAIKNDPKTKKFLEEQLTGSIARYITETRTLAMEKINKSSHSSAATMFGNLRDYILKNIDRFDLNQATIDDVVGSIDDRTKIINKTKFESLITERDDVVKTLFEKLGETNSAVVFMCLIDCAYHEPIAHFLQKISSKNQSLTVLFRIGWWTVLIYGIGLLFLIPAYIWNGQDVTYVRE